MPIQKTARWRFSSPLGFEKIVTHSRFYFICSVKGLVKTALVVVQNLVLVVVLQKKRPTTAGRLLGVTFFKAVENGITGRPGKVKRRAK